MKMGKTFHRAVIKYLQEKELVLRESHADMVSTLGDDAVALSTMQKWTAEIKRGRQSLEDDPRPGRPATTTTQKTQIVFVTRGGDG